MERTRGTPTPEEYKADLEKVHKFNKEQGTTWMHASQQTVEDLVRNRFLISGYPTMVLLDPNGKVFSMDVRGEKLQVVLEKVLPVKGETAAK